MPVALSNEDAANLLVKPKVTKAKAPALAKNKSAPYVRPHVEVFPCNICGCCEHPGQCVSSVECPECGAGIQEQCLHPNGGFVTYHEERWLEVQRLYGVYYKCN